MPDRWQVTAVSDTTDRSGRIEAWEITLTRQFDDVAVSVWLPKMTIENTAVAYGLTSTDEALDVILHQMVLPIYEPDEVEPNPWYVSGKEARNAVLERVERCKRDYATVATAVQKQRAAADVLAPLRSVRIDPVKCAAVRLEQQRTLLRVAQ